MLIVMQKDATTAQHDGVQEAIRSLGFEAIPVPGPSRMAICVVGNDGPVSEAPFVGLGGIAELIRVSQPYKLVSREVHPENTVISVGNAQIGAARPVLMAGPCSVETESRTLEIARQVAAKGAEIFRAGAYKPRTSPYSFQGLGEEGLHTLKCVRDETGLAVVTEVIDPESVDIVASYVDILQIGARNMQNFSLIKKAARAGLPVLLKRGLSATIEEWLMAAEYILSEGNKNVILCERGIRTFSTHARNTLDLNVVPLVQSLSHLPIVVDPSHGVGDRNRVRPMARAGLAAGASGLLIEVHTAPDTAYSDGAQTISVEDFEGIGRDAELIAGLEDL